LIVETVTGPTWASQSSHFIDNARSDEGECVQNRLHAGRIDDLEGFSGEPFLVFNR
jgi:hypothetical protein